MPGPPLGPFSDVWGEILVVMHGGGHYRSLVSGDQRYSKHSTMNRTTPTRGVVPRWRNLALILLDGWDYKLATNS